MRKLLLIIAFMLTTNMVGQSFILQEKDKQAHFAVGIAVGALGYHWSYKKHGNKTRAQITAMAASISAGILKELYDNRTGGTVEGRDVLATSMGGALFTVTIPLFQKKKK
jgi:uncharacterized protein YfiM (DUF2279 family)